MRLVSALGCFLLLGSAATAFAADKTSPDYLRRKHAGMVTFSSDKTVAELYPDLLKSAQQCHDLRVAPGGATPTMGAVGAMSSASREVSGNISERSDNAYIVIAVVGFFGATKSNFLQIDLGDNGNGADVRVFHRNNAKGQKSFIEEVRHWLEGDLAFCSPHPFMIKQMPKSKNDG